MIAAALSWYLEPIPFLERLVRSLTGVVDELVALDGRWKGYDDGAVAYSTAEEHDVLANECIAAGITHRIVETDRPWGSQVAKRARLMELAAENESWVLVIDGDDFLHEADGLALRASLELTSLHVAEIMAQRTNEPWPHSGLPLRPYPIRRLFRARDDVGNVITVERAHNGYRLGSKWLLGDRARVTLEPALDLSRVVTLHHDADRGAERRAKQKDYYQERKAEQLEAWR